MHACGCCSSAAIGLIDHTASRCGYAVHGRGKVVILSNDGWRLPGRFWPGKGRYVRGRSPRARAYRNEETRTASRCGYPVHSTDANSEQRCGCRCQTNSATGKGDRRAETSRGTNSASARLQKRRRRCAACYMLAGFMVRMKEGILSTAKDGTAR